MEGESWRQNKWADNRRLRWENEERDGGEHEEALQPEAFRPSVQKPRARWWLRLKKDGEKKRWWGGDRKREGENEESGEITEKLRGDGIKGYDARWRWLRNQCLLSKEETQSGGREEVGEGVDAR